MQMQQISVQPASPAGYAGAASPYSGQTNFSPLPPPQQSMDVDRTRAMIGSVEGVVPGVSRLLYHAYASDRVTCMHNVRGCFQPWTCACLPAVSDELRKGRYVQVYDNKIEINEPDSYMVGCGTCVVRDRISTIHFDRALAQNASKAEMCGPSCSHGDCFPDCFRMYGDSLVLHTDRAHCCSLCNNCCKTINTTASVHTSNSACPVNLCDIGNLPCLPCFPTHKLVFAIDNAAELASKINAAKALKGAPRAQPPF